MSPTPPLKIQPHQTHPSSKNLIISFPPPQKTQFKSTHPYPLQSPPSLLNSKYSYPLLHSPFPSYPPSPSQSPHTHKKPPQNSSPKTKTIHLKLKPRNYWYKTRKKNSERGNEIEGLRMKKNTHIYIYIYFKLITNDFFLLA